MFITLTTGANIKVRVNVDQITHYNTSGERTTVYLASRAAEGQVWLSVIEPVEEIDKFTNPR